MGSVHKSVLLQESIEALNLSPGKTFLDGTFGGGGHSREVRKIFGDKVQIIGLDRDPEVAKENTDFDVRTLPFSQMDKLIDTLEINPNAILLDLGLSSDQLETSERGFSFLRDEPLDMRMSQTGITAAQILNSWDESAIELILKAFGEEKFSDRIAKEIVRTRTLRPFERTTDLVETIESVVPGFYRHARIHPATRTFQALRIAVNEELNELEKGLQKGFQILKKEGRLAVISFHSLEDRMVKNFFRSKSAEDEGKLITKKPIAPTEEETRDNPRARSAKLRVIEKS